MPAPAQPKLRSTNLNFYYGTFQALHGISLDVHANKVTAFIGPSGCGKSTFLRTLNRMNETIKGHPRRRRDPAGRRKYSGDGSDRTCAGASGMVFQRPNPFPKSIFDNIAYGLRINGMGKRSDDARSAWSEPAPRRAVGRGQGQAAQDPPIDLSGGQQQRLCIARALAVDPEVLLLDEPCSALDPIATAKIEELLFQLKDSCTIVIVTHNMQQAARVADYTGFFLHGQADGVRHHRSHLQESGEERDRRLHHRPIRLIGHAGKVLWEHPWLHNCVISIKSWNN